MNEFVVENNYDKVDSINEWLWSVGSTHTNVKTQVFWNFDEDDECNYREETECLRYFIFDEELALKFKLTWGHLIVDDLRPHTTEWIIDRPEDTSWC